MRRRGLGHGFGRVRIGCAAWLFAAAAAAHGQPASDPSAADPVPAREPVSAATLADDASASASVRQPRPYGHTVGDVLTQRLRLPDGAPLPPATAWPAPGRTGRWFDRWPAQVETDAEGRRWLRVDSQLVNAPREAQLLTLPPLTVALPGGGHLSAPAWPVAAGPLTLPQERLGALPAWREDRPVPPREQAAMSRQLHAALWALAAVLAAWLGWWAWRQPLDARRLPFAGAWHALRRADPASPEAWRALHRAIDRSAGQVVHGASLPQLLAARPAWQPLGAQLEAFYRASAERFFDPAARAPGGAAFPLRELARALYRVERAEQR